MSSINLSNTWKCRTVMLRSPIRTLRESTQSLAQRSVHLAPVFSSECRHPCCPSGQRTLNGLQEVIMKRSIAVVIAALVIIGAGRASAQEVTPGPGTIEITLIPGGATFYTSTDTAPEFGNYTFGAGVSSAINRILGVEGEVAGTVGIGISQDLA